VPPTRSVSSSPRAPHCFACTACPRSKSDGFSPPVTPKMPRSSRFATSCWTGPSSGTNTNSDGYSTNTSSTTTPTDPTEGSNNGHPTTPKTSSRSAKANRSNDMPPAQRSSTNTPPQPEPRTTGLTNSSKALASARPHRRTQLEQSSPSQRTSFRHAHPCIRATSTRTASAPPVGIYLWSSR